LFKVAEISSHGEYSYYGSVFIAFEIFLAFTNELNVAQKRKKILMND
jgi:hypothetical protein